MTAEIAAAAVDKRFDAYIEAAVATGLVTEVVADDFTDALAAKRKQPATLIGELDELSQKRIREGFASPAALETLWAARMTGKMDTHMCEVEIQRLSEAWQEMGFLGRHAFFVAVRMNRGHWEEGPADGLAPDSLCLDLLEYALLKADTYAGIFADTLRGVIHPICDCEETADQEPQAEAKVKPRGPLAAMLRMQEYWYTELADRNPKLAETENMDPEDMEAVTFMFLVWFGEAFSRWLARVPSPSLALPCVLGGAYAALPHLDARVERLRAGRQLSERGYARSKADRKEVIGSTKRIYVRLEHVKLWMRADDETLSKSAGRLGLDEMFRPYGLQVSDIDNASHLGVVPIVRDAWPVLPSGVEVLSRLLDVFIGLGIVPEHLLIDPSVPEWELLGPWLHHALGIRCLGNACEYSSLFRIEAFDEPFDEFIDAAIEDGIHSAFLYRSTPLSEIAPVELLREFYSRAAEFRRAAPWKGCNRKLGVLIPGCSWRLGVPMGNLGKLNGGFAIDAYDTAGVTGGLARVAAMLNPSLPPASPGHESSAQESVRAGYSKMPALLYFREDDVPFADVESAEANGFELDEGEWYPVPIFNGPKGKPLLCRPSKADLEWMVRALPAALAFCAEHKVALEQLIQPGSAMHSHLDLHGKRLSTTFTTTAGALPSVSVLICYPPPAEYRLPDREEVNDDAARASIVGRRMRIHGLASRPELNGTWGTLTAYHAAKIRYAVKLDAGVETLLIRPANLEWS